MLIAALVLAMVIAVDIIYTARRAIKTTSQLKQKMNVSNLCPLNWSEFFILRYILSLLLF